MKTYKQALKAKDLDHDDKQALAALGLGMKYAMNGDTVYNWAQKLNIELTQKDNWKILHDNILALDFVGCVLDEIVPPGVKQNTQ